MDLLSLSRFNLLQDHLLKWQVAPSDGVGWLTLSDPTPAVPVCNLASKSTPLLALVAELKARGWRHRLRERPHLPRDAEKDVNWFRLSGQGGRPEYFRCLLQLNDVWAKGAEEVEVFEANSYYTCLISLANISMVKPGMGETHYKRLLRRGALALEDGSTTDDSVEGGGVQLTSVEMECF